MRYISVRDWRRFQHYDPTKRQPPWIKNYIELMSDDDYLALSGHRRAILHGIWLEYATARCRLPADTLTLTRRLSLKVVTRDLEALKKAGFLTFVASAKLAEGYQSSASKVLPSRAPAQSQEAEAEENLDKGSSAASYAAADLEGLNDERHWAVSKLLAALPDKDAKTPRVVARFAVQLPPAAIDKVRESVLSANGVSSPTAYAVNALKSEIQERTR